MAVLNTHGRSKSRFAHLVVFGLLALGGASAAVRAQSAAQPAAAAQIRTPTLEVASIKRNKQIEDQRNAIDPLIPQIPGRAQTLRGGNIVGRGMTVKELIRDAYGFRNRAKGEVTGGPTWLNTEIYDVQAKFD